MAFRAKCLICMSTVETLMRNDTFVITVDYNQQVCKRDASTQNLMTGQQTGYEHFK